MGRVRRMSFSLVRCWAKVSKISASSRRGSSQRLAMPAAGAGLSSLAISDAWVMGGSIVEVLGVGDLRVQIHRLFLVGALKSFERFPVQVFWIRPVSSGFSTGWKRT